MGVFASKGFHFYRGEQKWLARGVTYGPFRPDEHGNPYPESERQRRDFEAIAAMGANALRLYNVPDETLASLAAASDLNLLIDIPWPKHLDVYQDPKLRKMCLKTVEEGIAKVQKWPNLLGVFLGNEVPADLVRWVGARRVEGFLRHLYEEAKRQAPNVDVGFSNFPSTEYLRLAFFDFLGFNVYLHDPSAFRDYLLRLRHLYPEKPLILSEFGLDGQHYGEAERACLLSASLRAAYEVGMAGVFVFSWTDEWHTGGYEITEWSFGLVDRARCPKPSAESVARVFQSAPRCVAVKDWPEISIVVATYNGGRTLCQCVESLERLNYPSYEILVVDDGSTDETSEILKGFSGIRVITQPNRGLGAARNTGIEAARGQIVAFTDSDCFADSDWLYHLSLALDCEDFVGVGGPNLSPVEARPVARCVALAPGHATHVLLSNSEAEHIPGCNMAFRKEALVEVGGFDVVFRKAGDDVDLVWRLQDLGYRVGFSPAAFVWHHRRPTLKGYWKQQMGYGEAEALLIQKHPNRFNELGHSIWRGTIYSNQGTNRLVGRSNVRYGVFGSAGYQCVYFGRGSDFSHAVTSLEWWLFCSCMLLLGLFVPTALKLGTLGVGLSVITSSLKSWRRISEGGGCPITYLPLVALLWITQPLVRSGMRYWSRLRAAPPSRDLQRTPDAHRMVREVSFWRTRVLQYWGESAPSRLDVLRRLSGEMAKLRWIYFPNTEWQPWDLSVLLSWWFKVRITSAEEDHGAGKRLLRLRLRLIPSASLYLLGSAGFVLCLATALHNTVWSRALMVGLLMILWITYRQALRRRSAVENMANSLAQALGFIALEGPRGAATQKKNASAKISAGR